MKAVPNNIPIFNNNGFIYIIMDDLKYNKVLKVKKKEEKVIVNNTHYNFITK